jgi:hypothetical protein
MADDLSLKTILAIAFGATLRGLQFDKTRNIINVTIYERKAGFMPSVHNKNLRIHVRFHEANE